MSRHSAERMGQEVFRAVTHDAQETQKVDSSPTPPLDDFALAELLDVIEQLCSFLRVATFDEVEGEREARTRAKRVLEKYHSYGGI